MSPLPRSSTVWCRRRLFLIILAGWLLVFVADAWVATASGGKGATKGAGKGESGIGVTRRGGQGVTKRGEGGTGESLKLSKRIDPSQYILGPGDVLVINLWGEYDEVYEQTVSAEGKISLPTIGELMVSGETLARAEARLGVEVRKYYRNVQSGISLRGLRQFKVAVLGAVQEPGSYPATLDMRVSDVVALAGGVLPGGSLRKIQLKQGETVRAICDLNAYLKRGVEQGNPFLRDGDVVFVPTVSGNLVRVFDPSAASGRPEGELLAAGQLPVEYEIEPGQTISSLIKDLGGPNPAWDYFNVYVVRPETDGTKKKRIPVDLLGLLLEGDSGKDVVLQKGDQVFIRGNTQAPYLNGRGEIVGIEVPFLP